MALALLTIASCGKKEKSFKELAKNQKFILDHVKGIEYKVDYLTFRTEMDCEAHCTIKLFEPKPGSNKPNTVAMRLFPVRKEGKWYLTVKLD